jgi:hypothetical protein
MSRFIFRSPQWREIEPSVWLSTWVDRYNKWGARHGNRDNRVYFELIAKHGKLSGEDFERIGQWKEQCWPPKLGRWKTGTPAAYDVWMQANAALPICPDKDGVAAFLKGWSERRFLASHKQRKDGKPFTQAFGISRATTLLHFISGGLYPILDSTVQASLARLGSPVENTIGEYINVFCPLFSELASVCGLFGTEGLRKLDNALTTYTPD